MSHLDPGNRVYVQGFAGDPTEYEALCHWFARCVNLANGVADAGPLGHLPICKRCAETVGLTDFVAGGVPNAVGSERG